MIITHAKKPFCAVIGAGPAGLFAAETLARAGADVCVYDHKPSPARKFLMAGRGGLNITHSEDIETFLTRYGAASAPLTPLFEPGRRKPCVSFAHVWERRHLLALADVCFLQVLKPHL